MTTIVTRITGDTAKNAPLTNAELDNNFINLNTDKVEASANIVTLSGLGALKVPSGTTGEQPTPVAGMIRYNTTTGLFEAYRSSNWTTVDNATSTNTINTIVKRDAVGNFAVGNITGENITLNGTSAIKVPSGTTGQRPLVPSNGMFRHNSDTNSIEGYQNDVWGDIATLTGAQTLTNKTLSSAVLSGTLTAGGGVGTAGYILTSTGSGVQWEANAGSGAAFSPTVSGSTSAYATKRVLQYNEATGAVTYSNTLDAVSPYITGYSAEIHVSPVAFDNSGNGTIGDPVKTIAQAQVLAALAFETTGVGERKTIVLHPGNYSENVTINTQFTFLTTRELIGKNTTLSGTLTISKGCTIDGLKITNLVIDATSADGTVDIIGCTVSTATTKTSTAYANFRQCDLSVSSLSITGGGIVALVGGNYGTVTVNNASASVLAKAVVTMGPVTLTAGTLQLAETVVYSATNTSNAITQSAGSVVTLYNSQTLIPALTSVARNSFGGYYSIINSVYDKTNTTFGGISLSSSSYSQLVNADRLTLNGSTSGSTILNATAVAGTTTLTLPSATDTLVGRATADTLTNKTLSSSSVIGSLTADGSTGTSGHVLTSTGSGVQWAANAGPVQGMFYENNQIQTSDYTVPASKNAMVVGPFDTGTFNLLVSAGSRLIIL